MAKSKSKFVRFVIKPILWTFLILLLVIILAVAGVFIFLDPIAKFAAEEIAPGILGVDVELESIHISPLRGRVEIRKLEIENPKDRGYDSEHAIYLGHVDAEIDPVSVLSGKKIVIRDMTLKDIDINYESDLLLNSNIQDIIDNINRLSAEQKTKQAQQEEKDGKAQTPVGLQIDHFAMERVGLYAVAKGTKGTAVGIPITIDPIGPVGTEPEGITPFDFALQVMSEILVSGSQQAGIKVSEDALNAANKALDAGSDLANKAVNATADFLEKASGHSQDAGEKTSDAVRKAGDDAVKSIKGTIEKIF